MNQPKNNIPAPKDPSYATIPIDPTVDEHASPHTIITQEEKQDQFDTVLSHVIDRTLKHVLGKTNTHTIYKHLKKNGCSLKDIPKNPKALSTELRNILGNETGQIAGAASILEQTILESLTAELKIEKPKPYSAPFAENIKKLKETFYKKN